MNDKVVKSIIAIVSFAGGLALGIYKTTLDYESHLGVMEANIKLEIKQAADDVKKDIETLIQNRVLTK